MRNAVVLIPAMTHIDWRLHEAIRATGTPIIHTHGCSDLVKTRCRLLTLALGGNAETIVFCDADVIPTPDQIVQLMESERLDDSNAVTGAYVVGAGHVAAVADDGSAVDIPNDKRFVHCLVAGMGFAAVKRTAVERLRTALPNIEDEDGAIWHPYFLPSLLEQPSKAADSGGKYQYLSEDYSFWWRLKNIAAVDLWLDTSLVVGHFKPKVVFPNGVART